MYVVSTHFNSPLLRFNRILGTTRRECFGSVVHRQQANHNCDGCKYRIQNELSEFLIFDGWGLAILPSRVATGLYSIVKIFSFYQNLYCAILQFRFKCKKKKMVCTFFQIFLIFFGNCAKRFSVLNDFRFVLEGRLVLLAPIIFQLFLIPIFFNLETIFFN